MTKELSLQQEQQAQASNNLARLWLLLASQIC